MLAFLMKASVTALQEFPEFNASLDASGENLTLKKYFHIGFAADTPNGLVVPVVRDCDQKGVMEIARESSELAKKARDGKLGPAQMSGGCFSISSLGGIGGTRSEEHTSELQSLMRISYAVFCLKKKKNNHNTPNDT